MGDEAYHEAADYEELRAVLAEAATALGVYDDTMTLRELGTACLARIEEIRSEDQLPGTGKPGRPMSPRTVEVLKHACPVCKAGPGERCRTTRVNANSPYGEPGMPARPHGGRIMAVLQARKKAAQAGKEKH